MESIFDKILRFITTFGTRGLVFVARAYLGPAANRPRLSRAHDDAAGGATVAGLSVSDIQILALALSKLAYEAGEIALKNPELDGAKGTPDWQLDDNGDAPALSLAYLLAARRTWGSSASMRIEPVVAAAAAPRASAHSMRASVRNDYYASRARIAPARAATMEATRMATHAHAHAPARIPASTGGCGSCGGSHPTPPQPPPCYDPCAGGIPPAKRSTERCPGCGGGGGGCSCDKPAPTKTYDPSQCPTWAISCETKTRLRDCVKVALCDFASCASDTLCPGGRFDRAVLEDPATKTALENCLGQLVCSFLHCLPDALCPPAEECAPDPIPVECLPCDYAVEVVR